MVERRDYMALEWLRGDVDKALQSARTALQRHMEAADEALLQTSQSALQQVRESLRMVECHSAELLVDELEQLNQALLDDEVAAEPGTLNTLIQATEQLPVYLARLAQGQDDSRALVLPAVNKLRAARGDIALTDSALFHPDTTDGRPRGETRGIELFRQTNVLQLVRKLRQMYELALLGWLRDIDVEANAQYLGKAVSRLSLLTRQTPVAALWRVSDAFITALIDGQLTRTPQVIDLLRQLDLELKHLLENPIELVSLP
ncbi:hybrid sensor histidine kinase/response regulator, partial [bacterium]|nr:hybrid sensor histidine kinase/response regulator [bacterium]